MNLTSRPNVEEMDEELKHLSKIMSQNEFNK